MSNATRVGLVNDPGDLAGRLSAVWRVPVEPVASPAEARRLPRGRTVVYLDQTFVALPRGDKYVPGCMAIVADATDELVGQVALCGGETVAVVDDSDETLLLAWLVWRSGARMASPAIDGRLLYRLYGNVLRVAGQAWCGELTDREREVLDHVLSGASNAAIASAMFIQQSTVESHVRSILRKYGVSDRMQLATTYLSGNLYPDLAKSADLHAGMDVGRDSEPVA